MFCFIHCPNLNKTELIHTRVVVINIKETKALYIGLADKTHPKDNTIPAFDFQRIAKINLATSCKPTIEQKPV